MMNDEWAYWARNVTVTNAATGASDISFLLDVGAAGNNISEGEFLMGEVTNGDTVARNVLVTIGDGITTVFSILPSSSLNAGAVFRMPFVGQAFAAAGNNADINYPYSLGGGMRLSVVVSAVALSQDATFGFVLRWRGLKPTLTRTGQAPLAETNVVDMVW